MSIILLTILLTILTITPYALWKLGTFNIIINFFMSKFGLNELKKDDLVKMALLGIIFSLIIGTYWTLRPLKDTLFCRTVGDIYLPKAKMLSLFVNFIFVFIYSRLIISLSRKNMFYVMSIFYGLSTIIFALLFLYSDYGIADTKLSTSRIIGWAWYAFVESYGSLFVALFWSSATSITQASVARVGFSLIVLIGQLGAIIIPFITTQLPKMLIQNLSDFWNGKIILISGILILLIIPLIQLFYNTFSVVNINNAHEKEDIEEEENPGFFEGLLLLLRTPYLLGIFAIISFYEIIITVYDYYFKLMVNAQITSSVDANAYLSMYGTLANTMTFIFLILGVNKIQKYFGMFITLLSTPFLVFLSVFLFKYYFSLKLMLFLMVSAKGINYALNGPSLKQLYIPTSSESRNQAQAWIETFGSRGSKALASVYNNQHGNWLKNNGPEWACEKFRNANVFSCIDQASIYHLALSTYLFFGIISVWVLVAYYIAKQYENAIKSKQNIC